MALIFSTNTANAMLDIISSKIDAGTGSGKIKIYSGTIPQHADSQLSNNILLGELICSSPVASSASNGVLTFNTISQDTSANASGIATFFRIEDSSGTTILQGDVTLTGQGGGLEMNTINIISGSQILITTSSYSIGI